MLRMRIIGTALVMLATAGVTMGAIEGTAHDFRASGWADNEICKPCHTPHHANIQVDAPLWNHALPSSSQDYIMHEGTFSRDEALDDLSILCMGCHDGTVALDSFGGNTAGTTFIGDVDDDKEIGTNLTDDHPVGVDAVYPVGVSWMKDPSTWEGSPRGFNLQDLEVDGSPERVVGCTTCHNVHGSTGLPDNLLRVDNTASALCLKCHNR